MRVPLDQDAFPDLTPASSGSAKSRILIVGKLFERAIHEAQALPDQDQEAIGAWLLAEIDSERRWDRLFAQPSNAIEELADEALRDHEAGLTTPLDPDNL